MLKWTVYGKKNQEVPIAKDSSHEEKHIDSPFVCKQSRRSLDANSVKKSKKPSRYQRRSLGSAAIKRNNKNDDKENINYIGSTPNYYREAFQKKEGSALKDVSNITPTLTPVKNFEMKRYYLNGSKDDIPPDLPPTPPSYRRVREAKKRKLETNRVTKNDSGDFIRNSDTSKSERRVSIKDDESASLIHSTSEPSLNDLKEKLNESLHSKRNSFVAARFKHPVNTTKSQCDGLVEIEYEKDLVINCIEKPIKTTRSGPERTTLPIFGHHIFLNNPLYFNKLEGSILNMPLKRPRKKSNEFETSFKSPTIDKKDTHALVSKACSPVSVTPLSSKLAALQFSTMSTHNKSKIENCNEEVSDFFPKVNNPYAIHLRDEEISTEMENKFILSKDSAASETESTVSTTAMGDVTLENMIEEIIKSTKLVKTRRRILQRSKSPITVDATRSEAKDLFVKPQADIKTNLIKEAKYVNLSRENSISPKHTPIKKKNPIHRVNDKILKKLPLGCVTLDDGDGYNEREIKTPEVVELKQQKPRKITFLERSQSMTAGKFDRSHLKMATSESTPDLYSTCVRNANRLKRQRCIRRKKSTITSGIPELNEDLKSILPLEIKIPSPATELHNVSIPGANNVDNDYENSSLKNSSSFRSIASHSSAMSQNPNCKPRDLFGLTLENGIPSPITPVSNLKRPNDNSGDRAHKTCKVDEEQIMPDAFTPVIEHKSSRRCLKYSPEESIDSCEEKRRSVVSNRSIRSDKFSLKGTIDLKVVTKNDVIDVHVIRCRDLQRTCGKIDDINAYAKVVINGLENQSIPSQRSIFQRTSVLYGNREPEFQRHLRLPLPTAVYDSQVLHISVWHRDKKYRRSEFLGCVSFPLNDAIKGDIEGSYFLQSQIQVRHTPAAADSRCPKEISPAVKMATDNVDGHTNENKENPCEKGLPTNGLSALSSSQTSGVSTALQKEADEHIFLRYLELDPPDDPAVPRKTPRVGRTPFTTTRKLLRGSTGGFGFTVVWTRPPRVERVAATGSAEKAGVRAGDYVVFVGNKNVVMSGEEEVRGLVKSAGNCLNLETYRRVAQNGVGVGAKSRVPQVSIGSLPSEMTPPPFAPSSPAPPHRPPTACSSTSQSLDRRKLHLPQVTFSKEAPATPIDGRKKALQALISREQHYTTCLQFGLGRFVTPLAERADIISPTDHQLLFQNIEEILRLSEDVLDQIGQEDSDIHTTTVIAVYLQRIPIFLSLYKKYCLGLKRADCVLVKKSKDPSGSFSRFCTTPPIPRRRPDITSLVHKPLEQFREILRLMRAASAATGAGPYEQMEKKQLQHIVDQLQSSYQDVTAGSGLMGLAGEGRPLLSVADLEGRLVFTRCKPFVLSTGGRQWIFGGELSKVEGRTARPYWALLFTDLLLFTTVSRDRVLFVTEEPVLLTTVSEGQFNIRKKVTDFRLLLGRNGGESPLVSCSPRTSGRVRSLILRAPSIDLKAVWQSLLQRQIFRAHTMPGALLASPLDSPDPQLTFSLATLDSQQRQYRRSSVETQTAAGGSGTDIARSSRSKGSSQHLQRWMTQLSENDELDNPDPNLETWSVEELRKRSKELNLIDLDDAILNNNETNDPSPSQKRNDKSPSKSSSGSQVTVRNSPVVLDTIPVCKKCHQKCFSKPNSPQSYERNTKDTQTIDLKQKTSPTQMTTSLSPKSCIEICGSRNKKQEFSKGAKPIRPEDAPRAALKVLDSIEQSQKMLKSTSYELKSEVSRSNSPYTKSQLELRSSSIRSASPISDSRNNSPFSTSHTTCSSMVFNSSFNDLRMSNTNISNQVQCVIAQEKYLNEVKCVERLTLLKNNAMYANTLTPGSKNKDDVTRHKAERVLNKILGVNIIARRENVGTRQNSSPVFLDEVVADGKVKETEKKVESRMKRSPKMGISVGLNKLNGEISTLRKNPTEIAKQKTIDDNEELRSLMLMGLSAVNPVSHYVGVDSFSKPLNGFPARPEHLGPVKQESPVPNIAIEPPTPVFYGKDKQINNTDDSPDSLDLAEEPPYVTLKRYGTLSSLERFPSDETDDGSAPVGVPFEEVVNTCDSSTTPPATLMSWTARAGSFVVEKMNIFSYSESVPSVPTTTPITKQPSFLERYLGVSEWRSGIGQDDAGADNGEGSGASGEDAWGTPSSGDLSDNMPDSDHGTLSSPTKSSSSYPGDDDTELMMDELLMAPTITGPTTLRPLLPRDVYRRRLEPLLEEEFSDSGSEDNKQTPTNENQGSVHGPSADDCCDARPTAQTAASTIEEAACVVLPTSVIRTEESSEPNSPDKTPTGDVALMLLESASKEYADMRANYAGAVRRGSASSASTPSTLERTTIHNPPTPQHQETTSGVCSSEELEDNQRASEHILSPRAEMRLALDQGKDILAEQEASWAGVSDPWSFRAAACQWSLLRRVSSADAVTHHGGHSRPSRPTHRTAPHTTSRSSVYAWKVDPKNEQLMEMESLARAEAQTMCSRTQPPCQNRKIFGFLRRRASSDSPRREPMFGNTRPFSPRRTTVSKQGYYKICFVNGYS